MVGFHDHQAWDGTQYYAVYHFFCDGTYGSVTGLANVHPFFPYNQRILIPLLASLVSPTDSIWGFRLVNSMFLVLSVMACYVLWVKYCHLSKAISLLGIFFFLFHWAGPIRGTSECVYTVDPPVYFFEILFLCAIFSKKYLWLIPLSVLSVLDKEMFVYIFFVFFIYALCVNLLRKEQKYPLVTLEISAFSAFLTSLVLTRYPIYDHGSGIVTVIQWGYLRVTQPLNFLRIIVSFFTAYGAFGVLACVKPLPGKQSHFPEIFVLTCLTLAFALLGGSDYTRISFLGFPFVMTLILMIIQDYTSSVICASFLTLPVMRLLNNIPDPVVLVPSNDTEGIYSWMMEYADIGIVAGWGVYFLFCFVLLNKINVPVSVITSFFRTLKNNAAFLNKT